MDAELRAILNKVNFICNWDGCPFETKKPQDLKAHQESVHDYFCVKEPHNRAPPGREPRDGELGPYEVHLIQTRHPQHDTNEAQNVASSVKKSDVKFWADKPHAKIPPDFAIDPICHVAIRKEFAKRVAPRKHKIRMVNGHTGEMEDVEFTRNSIKDVVKQIMGWHNVQNEKLKTSRGS